MTKAQKLEQQEARERLAGIINQGDTIYCVLRHVARSGMSRRLTVHLAGGAQNITRDVALACDYPLKDVGMRWEIVIGGCGFDAACDVGYNLSYALWGVGDCRLKYTWI